MIGKGSINSRWNRMDVSSVTLKTKSTLTRKKLKNRSSKYTSFTLLLLTTNFVIYTLRKDDDELAGC